MKKQYDFKAFCEIIEMLRSEKGCPWDREQSHYSLRSCMLEEAYEVIDGIDQFEENREYDNLREELGDVLLQVVMHSQIAKEEELFTIEDVIDEISEKMVRRHPHVFGEVLVADAEGVLVNWEAIKKEEKKGKVEKEGTFGVPEAFPALLRAQKVIKKEKKRSGKEESMEECFSLVEEKYQEFNTLKTRANSDAKVLQQMIGDLLFSICKVALMNGVDAEMSLAQCTKEFIKTKET